MFVTLPFGSSVTSWVLITLAGAFAIAFVLTLRTWREARLSPYYFQRREALHQMQSYSLASLTLLMATVGVLAYAWSPDVRVEPRTAILTNAKPVVRSAAAAPSTLTNAAESLSSSAETFVSLPASLPSEYSSLTPDVALNDNTDISSLIFALGINDNYEPVGARAVFGPDMNTLYATFDYSEMQDGMVWSWIWRYDGLIVGGGEQRWAYGDEGPGYVYLSPEEGFDTGEYTLEVWVNGELLRASDVEVSAGVANQ